jgi:hypothetical protein
MRCRTNLIVVVKIVDLDTSRIYNYNHMVGMDKISFIVKMFNDFLDLPTFINISLPTIL